MPYLQRRRQGVVPWLSWCWCWPRNIVASTRHLARSLSFYPCERPSQLRRPAGTRAAHADHPRRATAGYRAGHHDDGPADRGGARRIDAEEGPPERMNRRQRCRLGQQPQATAQKRPGPLRFPANPGERGTVAGGTDRVDKTTDPAGGSRLRRDGGLTSLWLKMSQLAPRSGLQLEYGL